MLVKVQFVFRINDAIMVCIDHLEQVLRLAVSDL